MNVNVNVNVNGNVNGNVNEIDVYLFWIGLWQQEQVGLESSCIRLSIVLYEIERE